MMTDPVADMLTRIRNAGLARHKEVRCPSSRLNANIARVMSEEGFVGPVRVEPEGAKSTLVIELRYRDNGTILMDGLRRISRPSLRVYVGRREVPKVRAGIGIAVLSTPKGVMCDRDARDQKVGGEVLCEVW